jgi:hypothetical protein
MTNKSLMQHYLDCKDHESAARDESNKALAKLRRTERETAEAAKAMAEYETAKPTHKVKFG